jgi:hypothetical protein
MTRAVASMSSDRSSRNWVVTAGNTPLQSGFKLSLRGYDPLFEIVEYHRTYAELGETVKSVLSHRARAIELLVPLLRELVGEQR